MADVRSHWVTLENPTTTAGVPLHHVTEGDAANARNAHAVLPVKDDSGNLQYIPMVDGKVSVTFQGGDISNLSDRGEHAGDNSTYQDIATIVLQNDTVYEKLGWVLSCFRDAHFEIVFIDDVGGTPTETVLADILCGPGDYTDSNELIEVTFTSGSTGTQNLVVRGKNMNAASTMRGTITIQENQ